MSFLCGAKRKGIDHKTGKPKGGTCTNKVRDLGQRCRYHGGRSLAGAAHCRYKARGYAANLPTKVAEHIAARVDDFAVTEDRLSLRYEIELADAMQGDELSKTMAGLTLDRVRGLRDLLERVILEQRASNHDAALRYAEELHDMASRAPTETLGTERVLRRLETMRELADTERKYQAFVHTTMTATQAMRFMGAVVQSCQEHITDRQQLSTLLSRLQELMGGSVRVGELQHARTSRPPT